MGRVEWPIASTRAPAPAGRGTQLRDGRARTHPVLAAARPRRRHPRRARAARGSLTSARLWRKCARDADGQADGRPKRWPRGQKFTLSAAGAEAEAAYRGAVLGARASGRTRPRGGARRLGRAAARRARATASSSPSSPGSGSASRTCARRSRRPGSCPTRSAPAIGRLVDAGIVEPVPLASQQPSRSDPYPPLTPRRWPLTPSPRRDAFRSPRCFFAASRRSFEPRVGRVSRRGFGRRASAVSRSRSRSSAAPAVLRLAPPLGRGHDRAGRRGGRAAPRSRSCSGADRPGRSPMKNVSSHSASSAASGSASARRAAARTSSDTSRAPPVQPIRHDPAVDGRAPEAQGVERLHGQWVHRRGAGGEGSPRRPRPRRGPAPRQPCDAAGVSRRGVPVTDRVPLGLQPARGRLPAPARLPAGARRAPPRARRRPGARVADLGAGTGHLALPLARLGARGPRGRAGARDARRRSPPARRGLPVDAGPRRRRGDRPRPRARSTSSCSPTRSSGWTRSAAARRRRGSSRRAARSRWSCPALADTPFLRALGDLLAAANPKARPRPPPVGAPLRRRRAAAPGGGALRGRGAARRRGGSTRCSARSPSPAPRSAPRRSRPPRGGARPRGGPRRRGLAARPRPRAGAAAGGPRRVTGRVRARAARSGGSPAEARVLLAPALDRALALAALGREVAAHRRVEPAIGEEVAPCRSPRARSRARACARRRRRPRTPRTPRRMHSSMEW